MAEDLSNVIDLELKIAKWEAICNGQGIYAAKV